MSEPVRKIDVAEWVARAGHDPVTHQQRQTVHVVLKAVALAAPSGRMMILKGGILMGLAYGSPRQTADVDLTASGPVDADTAGQIETWLEAALPRAAAALGYAGFITRIHAIKPRPKGRFETADFPGLTMKVRSERRAGTKTFVDVDISFKEELRQIEALELIDGNEILAYGLEDLIAEKYRAILQQVPRRRQRRQDVYDLDLLIAEKDFDDARKRRIFDTFIIKCRSRKIEPIRDSLENPEIRKRSEAEWPAMKLELGELPEFEACFKRVAAFYRELPWDCLIDRTEAKA